MELLDYLLIDAEQPAEYCVIWLHGLGASGHDFAPVVPQLQFNTRRKTRFIFPHAPSMPVTVNGGHVMPAWYDIVAMEIDRKVDVHQLRESTHRIHQLMDDQIAKGIDSRKLFLAGFSQGGAVALDASLTYSKPLAGLLFMSSYFATADTMTPDPANAQLEIMIHQGTADPIVPAPLARQARDRLAAMGYPVNYLEYPMAHSVCAEQLDDIDAWLAKCLA